MSSAICFNLDQSKIWLSGNGLKQKTSIYQNTEKMVEAAEFCLLDPHVFAKKYLDEGCQR